MKRDPATPYVTNTDRPVFAIRGLSEEDVAVLLAFYSRSAVSLRDALRNALASGDLNPEAGFRELASLMLSHPEGGRPADEAEALYRIAMARTSDSTSAASRAFHEKWVVGYGHGSVAEHAVAHFGIEECSILAAKAIEDSRLGTAFTEQSTRYVPFSRDTLVTSIGLRGDDQTLYEDAARGLLDAYGVVSDAFSVIADREFPSASPAARRGWVLDRARALLPCGTPTRLGVSMNGRAAAAMVRKLSDPTELPEVVRIAGAIREEGAKVLPSLMRRTDMDAGRFSRHRLLDRRPPGDYAPVYEHSVTIDGIEAPEARARLTRAMLEDVRGADVRTTTRTSQYEDTLRSYMVGRDRFDRPGRALEAIPVRLRLSLDYGAWRDVQRHRVFSAAPVYVRPRSGIDLPDLGLLPKDAQAVARSACTRAQVVGRELEAEYGPGIAQYVLPLGTLVRATMRGNLRGLVTFIELRSRPEGHDAYRAVAHKLQDALEKDPVLAELAKYIRCDRSPRTLARK